MSKKTVYNFLELEFKKLYDDMKIFVENKELRNIFNNRNRQRLLPCPFFLCLTRTNQSIDCHPFSFQPRWQSAVSLDQQRNILIKQLHLLAKDV